MNPPFFEIFDHSADLGVRISGKTMRDLFINAGLALFHLIAPAGAVAKEDFLFVVVSGEDSVDLLVNWLRELLYLFYGEERWVTSIDIVSMETLTLKARIGLGPFDNNELETDYEIKAVTYHQARIEHLDNGYTATVIFDL